jgi:hypothetical protein
LLRVSLSVAGQCPSNSLPRLHPLWCKTSLSTDTFLTRPSAEGDQYIATLTMPITPRERSSGHPRSMARRPPSPGERTAEVLQQRVSCCLNQPNSQVDMIRMSPEPAGGRWNRGCHHASPGLLRPPFVATGILPSITRCVVTLSTYRPRSMSCQHKYQFSVLVIAFSVLLLSSFYRRCGTTFEALLLILFSMANMLSHRELSLMRRIRTLSGLRRR